MSHDPELLKSTFFTKFHQEEATARFVSFAGYQMPISFAGIIDEHLHVAHGNVGLFDVSHMGQITISGQHAISEFEKLVPSNITNMPINQAKYTALTDENGGIIDDCIVTKIPENPDRAEQSLFVVVNGARKFVVLEHLQKHLSRSSITHHTQNGLLALQGKQAVSILQEFNADIADLKFMQSGVFDILNQKMRVTRCGYTGKDGFEIAMDISGHNQDDITLFYQKLLAYPNVKPIGLGARDTLRLEAGLCLYGQDIDMTTSIIEANIGWISCPTKTAQESYLGADIVKKHRHEGTQRKLVGLLPQTKAPIRYGTHIHNCDDQQIGTITSGTISPMLKQPIAMGYVETAYLDKEIYAFLRGKKIPMKVTKLPFIAHEYHY